MAEAKSGPTPSPAALKARRPLSPHLSIYRPMLTMMMSIVHRITGGALYFGTLLLAGWLVALASGPDYFAWASWFMGSILGKLILFGFTWALFQHLMGGIRHFIWDTGWGMTHPQREYLAQASVAGGLGLTILVWLIYFLAR
jgi:succinate dehydrogenase / fumarate reductase cytochrome b subunit